MAISNIPPLRHRNTVSTPADQDDFVSKYELTNDHLSNTFVPEMNSAISTINSQTVTVANNTAITQTATDISVASANYKGNWVANYNGSGYSVGMSVTYSDGNNYASKVNNNLATPTSLVDSTSWSYINKYYKKVSGVEIKDSGTVLIDTTTDNGVDKLQVNGSISAKNPSGSTSGGIKFYAAVTTGGVVECISIDLVSVYVEIVSSQGVTLFPIYTTGGAGVYWSFNYLNPLTGAFIHSNAIDFSFTEEGSVKNTYRITVDNGTGLFSIQATTKNSDYQITLKQI